MTPSPSEHDQDPSFALSTGGEDAVDLYIEADPLDANAPRELAAPRVAAILDLLRLSPSEESQLRGERTPRVNRTALSMPRTPLEDEQLGGTTVLSGAAARVVDGFVEGSSSLEALRVLELLDGSGGEADSAEDRAARIDRVMQAVSAQHRTEDARFRLSPPTRDEIGQRRRIQLSDFVAVAAVLLVGTAVLFPSLFSANTMAVETRCAQNMQRAGLGFDLFAQDHDGHLPAREDRQATDQIGGVVQWWRVGDPGSSHSANLFVLIRDDYVPMEALTCPGNKAAPVRVNPDQTADWQRPEQVSYSYQLFNGRPPRFSDSGIKLLLTDRSPVVTPAMRGETVDATANSHNHNERGQNLLLPDLSVYFVSSPVMGDGDNMWLPRSLESSPRRVRLTGTEQPTHGDAFVGP